MQLSKSKRLYQVEVVYPNGLTRLVKVKAATREAAEHKALKFHPHATGVKRDA